jgi:hypothetical protein
MSSTRTIFVSIACFMDPDVINTVADLFRQARHPERISVGICLQHDPATSVFDALKTLPRVSIDWLPYTEAKGPIYARQRCEQLLRDEDFFLQIDCHSRFFPGWDEILLEEFARCQQAQPNVILSHYPINIVNMEKPEFLDRIGRINRFRYIGADDIKMHGSLVKLPTEPLPSWGLSAALLFMEGAVKKRIPYDPNLHYGLHAAEQFLYSARLWTNGYDFMTPTRHAVATEYMTNRERIPKPAWQHYCAASGKWPKKTWTKVKYYLGLDELAQVDESYRQDVLDNRERYAPGTTRTLPAYYHHTNLHPELLKYFPYYASRHGQT